MLVRRQIERKHGIAESKGLSIILLAHMSCALTLGRLEYFVKVQFGAAMFRTSSYTSFEQLRGPIVGAIVGALCLDQASEQCVRISLWSSA